MVQTAEMSSPPAFVSVGLGEFTSPLPPGPDKYIFAWRASSALGAHTLLPRSFFVVPSENRNLRSTIRLSREVLGGDTFHKPTDKSVEKPAGRALRGEGRGPAGEIDTRPLRDHCRARSL